VTFNFFFFRCKYEEFCLIDIVGSLSLSRLCTKTRRLYLKRIVYIVIERFLCKLENCSWVPKIRQTTRKARRLKYFKNYVCFHYRQSTMAILEGSCRCGPKLYFEERKLFHVFPTVRLKAIHSLSRFRSVGIADLCSA